MRRSVLLCLLLLLCLPLVGSTPTPRAAGPSEWADISQQVLRSVGRVSRPLTAEEMMRDTFAWIDRTQGVNAICTAFSIDEKYGYWMTANHCVGKDETIDLTPAVTVWADPDNDVAILRSSLHKPALAPSPVGVRRGLPAAGFGYGYGHTVPMMRSGHVSIADTTLGGLQGRWTLMDFSFIGGMSGGPVVDDHGRVISLCQMSNEQVGIGRPLTLLLELTQVYWSAVR